MKAVAFAREVLDMADRIGELEYEVARLRDYERKYHELLGESIDHSKTMVDNLFLLAMKHAGEVRASQPQP